MGEALSNSELTEQLVQLADQHVSASRSTYGLELDFSEDSLLQLDRIISEIHPNGAALELTVIHFGAYVGETIRRNLGGDWMQDADGQTWLQNIGGQDVKVPPLAWAHKRFGNGSVDALTAKYARIKHLAAGDEPGARRLLEALDELKLAAMDQPQFADDMLARTPVLVFMMVAVADGNVDEKEQAMLAKLCNDVGQFPSPLFQTAVATMVQHAERYFSEFRAEGFDCQISLADAIEVLEDEHPDEAQAFKESLMAWGKAIAEASGGILGFGRKIGAEEAASLATIARLIDLDGTGANTPVVEDDSLGRAPLLVFMLVAAADGNVDKKERAMLAKLCENVEKFPSLLFRAAVGEMVKHAERYFEEFQTVGFDFVAALKATAAALDDSHPAEAKEFKLCLLSWGKEIAEASGGFLGFGKKMGQEEAQTLVAIAITLGLVDENGNPVNDDAG